MKLTLLLKMAFHSLGKHKSRSLLTTLGIIIGVTAIITVMSLGEGAKYRVREEIQKLGTNFIIAIAKSPKQQMMVGKKMFKEATLEAILNECDGIRYHSPAILQNTITTYEGASNRPNVTGVLPDYFAIREWPIILGDYFTNHDVKAGKKVALLGKTAAKELFDLSDPIGKTIRIKKIPFKIIGVLDSKGTNPGGQDEDDTVFIPLTTMQRKISGVTNKFMAMLFAAKSKEVVPQTTQQIISIIRQQHHLKHGEDDDFTIFTQDDISQVTDSAYAILNLLLFAIASVALLVGGIGIMNIMLVSVTERTREIGIRMALGAKQKEILNQFLYEAIIICIAGGIVGVIAGITSAVVVATVFGWPIFISKIAVLISVASSVLIGIFFGYYPAYKASNLNPVDALAER